ESNSIFLSSRLPSRHRAFAVSSSLPLVQAQFEVGSDDTCENRFSLEGFSATDALAQSCAALRSAICAILRPALPAPRGNQAHPADAGPSICKAVRSRWPAREFLLGHDGSPFRSGDECSRLDDR